MKPRPRTDPEDALAYEDLRVSYPPALAALAAVLVSVGVTVSDPVAYAGLALGLAAIVLWARELVREHGSLKELSAHPAEDGDEARWWRRRTRAWWGALAFTVVTVMVYVTALRALTSYGLIGTGHWPASAEPLFTTPALVATLALGGGAGSAWWAGRAAGREDASGFIAAALGAVVLGVAFLAAKAWETARLLERGFTPWETTAGSLFHWLSFVHALIVLAGVLALALLAFVAWRVRGAFHEYAGMARASARWWAFALVTWIVTVLLVYLHLVNFHVDLAH